MTNTRLKPLARQRGIATILIVLLTGLSMAAVVLGLIYRTRGAQEQVTAFHAQTQAQIKAWTGAQAVDGYFFPEHPDYKALGTALTELGQAFQTAQSAGDPLPTLFASSEALPGVTATLVSMTESGTGPIVRDYIFRIDAKSGEGERAEATAVLQTGYRVVMTAGQGSSGCSTSDPSCDNAVNFNRGLTMGGSIDIVGQEGKQYKINVKGDVDTSGNSISGLEIVNSTGSVTIGSGSSFGTVNANCDVKINGSVTIRKATAQRHVCTSGGAGIGESILANGTVIVNSSGQNGDIAAIGAGSCTGSTLRSCESMYSGSPLSGVYNGVYFTQGGGRAAKIDTKGKLSFSSTATVTGAASAEKDVRADSGVTFGGALNVGGDLAMTGGSAGVAVVVGNASLPNGGAITDLHVGGNLTSKGKIVSARISGDTQVAGGDGITQLLGGGSLNVNAWVTVGTKGTGCDGSTSNAQCASRVAGSITKLSQWLNTVYVRQDTSLVVGKPSPVSVSINPAEAVSITVGTFDAYALEAQANLAFKYVGGKIKVAVKNMSGIANGDYFLVDGGNDKKDFICPTESYSAASCARIGKGFSDYNTAITYNSGVWTLNGTELAPGILWFEGNLRAQNGVYYNTLIATGNIETDGSHKTYAPSYAGYDGTVDRVTYSPKGICNNTSFTTYPTQLCDKAKAAFNYLPLGNFALMAGSLDSQSKSYVGGNIRLGASTAIYGNVKAGNLLSSGGSTTIYGYLTALAQGSDSAINSLGGSTTIVVNHLPPSFDPNTDEGSGSGGGSSGSDSTVESVSRIGARVL